jgi:hypothetical protein
MHEVSERFTFDQLHHDKGLAFAILFAARFAVIIDGCDVLMVER